MSEYKIIATFKDGTTEEQQSNKSLLHALEQFEAPKKSHLLWTSTPLTYFIDGEQIGKHDGKRMIIEEYERQSHTENAIRYPNFPSWELIDLNTDTSTNIFYEFSKAGTEKMTLSFYTEESAAIEEAIKGGYTLRVILKIRARDGFIYETERDIYSPEEGIKCADEETITRAEEITDKTMRYFSDSPTLRPTGNIWTIAVLHAAQQFASERFIFTGADLEQMTQDNAHTCRHAAEIVMKLRRYMM